MKQTGFPQIVESKFPDISLTFPWPNPNFPDPKYPHLSSFVGNLWAWLVKQTQISSKFRMCLYNVGKFMTIHQNPSNWSLTSGNLGLTVVLKCLELLQESNLLSNSQNNEA